MPDVDRMYEAWSEQLWEEQNKDSACCRYCYHYNCPFCTYYDDYPEKQDDDWCEHFQEEGFAMDWEEW